MWCCVAGEVGPPVCSGLWLTLWGGYGSRGARDGTSPAIKAGCWPENLVPEPSWGRALGMEHDQVFLPRLYLYLQGPV